MRYRYKYKTSALDLWQLSMYYTYGSMTGACNIIFTGALIALTYSQWQTADMVFRIIMIFGCLLFTVIQPILVYRRAVKQTKPIKDETEISFGDKGIYVKVGEDNTHIEWKNIKKISKKPTIIVIFSNTTHGYVLTNKTLGEEKDELYSYVLSNIEGKR